MRRSPRDTQESFRTISRRGLLLAGLQGVFATTLAFRMRYLQLDQADEFRLLAEENSIKIRLIRRDRTRLDDGWLEPAMRDHLKVIAALEARDPAMAQAALSEHIENARRRALDL